MTPPARSTVRLLPLALTSTPPDTVPPDHTTPAELRAEIVRLRRAVTDHQVRMAAYIHALNRTMHGEPVEVSHVTCAAAPSIVALARALEAQRRAPVIRFVRDVRGQLTNYLELGVIVPAEQDEPALDTLPGGMMAVTDGEAV